VTNNNGHAAAGPGSALIARPRVYFEAHDHPVSFGAACDLIDAPGHESGHGEHSFKGSGWVWPGARSSTAVVVRAKLVRSMGSRMKIIRNGSARIHHRRCQWAHEEATPLTLFKTFFGDVRQINEYHYADINRFLIGGSSAAIAWPGIIHYALGRRQRSSAAAGVFFHHWRSASILRKTFYYAHIRHATRALHVSCAPLPITTFIAIGLSHDLFRRYHLWVLDTILFCVCRHQHTVLDDWRPFTSFSG